MSFLEISLDSSNIFGIILQGARSLFYWISELIYQVVIILYQLFADITNARLLDSDMFNAISSKVSVLLGIIMLFVVIFDFMQLLLDPEKLFDKDKGMFSIIKKVIIVLVGLGISGFVFESMYQFQNYVIENKLLYKIILPTSDTEVDTSNFGGVLAARTFTAFYDVKENLKNNEQLSDTDRDLVEECINYRNLLNNRIVHDGDFSAGNYCINQFVSLSDDGQVNNVFIMDYNLLLQIAVGVAIVYIFVNYIIKVGVRMIQLTVLQIISPAFIIGYLSPKKDNMFSKWFKLYFATYIDVFIRIFIIYFVVYLCGLILDSVESMNGVFWDSVGGASSKWMVMVVMILALLTFAKKAPDLIKDLLPSSASKLGFGLSMKEIVGLKHGLGIIGGAAAGAAVGTVGIFSGRPFGGVTGALKGGLSGLKGQGFVKTATGAWKSEAKANQTIANVRANGGSWLGYQMNQLQQGVGMRTAYDADMSVYNDNKAIADNYGTAKSEAEKEALKFAGNYYHANGYSLAELAKRKDSQTLTERERTEAEQQYNLLLDAATKFNVAAGRGVKRGKVSFNNNYDFSSVESMGRSYGTNDLGNLNLEELNDDNASIIYSRDYVLREADGVSKTGDLLLDAKNAKEASDKSKNAMAQHNTSKDVSRHKANAGK